jgi:hypothetical protein
VALGDALGGVVGAGGSWPGSAGQDSASMMGFPGAARTGAGPFSGRFQARLAATGLRDGGGEPAPATAPRGSAREAMIYPIGRGGELRYRLRRRRGWRWRRRRG